MPLRERSDSATSAGSRTTTTVVVTGVTVRQNGRSSERRGSFQPITPAPPVPANEAASASAARARNGSRPGSCSQPGASTGGWSHEPPQCASSSSSSSLIVRFSQ